MSNSTSSILPSWARQSPSDKESGITKDPIDATYQRLRLEYAQSLQQNWVEKLEQPKQILEQIYLAAYLIELWRGMYGTIPAIEQEQQQPNSNALFPGFVSIACGCGILVYILHMEGYKGTGFDACRRKTWMTYPDKVQDVLEERIYIPRPFLDAASPLDLKGKIHTGDFPADIFIISDHTDELTVWTPLMAALAHPSSPLPFFIIPCCSCSLSGARYRYPPKINNSERTDLVLNTNTKAKSQAEQNPQPASGDLRSLRATKDKEKTALGFGDSMMGSLAAKTREIAEECGFEVEETLLKSPGKLSKALVGRKKQQTKDLAETSSGHSSPSALRDEITRIIERDCAKDGGIQAAAKLWIEQARTLHGQQRE
jgi:tRNASer (uridine44-2'-O)-methyltransferase